MQRADDDPDSPPSGDLRHFATSVIAEIRSRHRLFNNLQALNPSATPLPEFKRDMSVPSKMVTALDRAKKLARTSVVVRRQEVTKFGRRVGSWHLSRPVQFVDAMPVSKVSRTSILEEMHKRRKICNRSILAQCGSWFPLSREVVRVGEATGVRCRAFRPASHLRG